MIGTMAVGGKAFADNLNAFNISMNRGHPVARWFLDRFGSKQCRALTQCDVATSAGVARYIESDGVGRYLSVAWHVADEVRRTIVTRLARETHRNSTVAG